MISLLKKYSAQLFVVATLLGLIFPEASAKVLNILPYVLFALMLLTLIGIKQQSLLQQLCRFNTWYYALLHSAGLSLVIGIVATILSLEPNLIVAIVACCATGSLFATPAIVKNLGYHPLNAMAFTIATTLLMPVVLLVNLSIFKHGDFNLDMQAYLLRLVIFIICPIIIAFVCFHVLGETKINRLYETLSQMAIVLTFTFPFGLAGSFGQLISDNISHAARLLILAIALIGCFYVIGLWLFRKQGKEAALTAAITMGNRNVLLTFVVAGSYLGPEYLALIGAMQLPIYALPLITKKLINQPWLDD